MRAPHLFKIVEGAHFRSEDVDDDVTGVDQHPVAMRQALDADAGDAPLLQRLDDVVGDRPHMAVRAAAGDDHVIGDRGLAFQIDADGVGGFLIVEPRQNDLQDLFGGGTRRGGCGRRLAGGGYAWTGQGCFPLPFCGPAANRFAAGMLPNISGHGRGFQPFRRFDLAAALSAVDDNSDFRPCRKTQIGGSSSGNSAASLSSMRARASVLAAGVASVERS